MIKKTFHDLKEIITLPGTSQLVVTSVAEPDPHGATSFWWSRSRNKTAPVPNPMLNIERF
jgi:hypothetical protein